MTSTAPIFNVRLGDKYYQIASDDQYLRQARRSATRTLDNLARKLTGRDAWEPRMTKLFRSLIEPNFKVLDIGANIGCTAILFSDIASQVVAFEPLRTTYGLLSENVARSGKQNIKTIQCALGDESKQAELFFSDTNRGMAFVLDRTSRDDSGTAKITIERLDEMFPKLSLDRVDFIKVDVEGYEPRVLAGGKQTIALQQPIVQMEFNAWCLDVQQRVCVPDFVDLVLQMFPLVYTVHDGTYIDLRTTEGRYDAMAQCLINNKYKEMVCAFREEQLASFKREFRAKPDYSL